MLPAACSALCLLQLPRDVLRYVFSSANLDVLSIALSRFVCRALRALVPLPRRRLSGIPIYLVDEAVRRRDLKLALWCAERLCRKAQEVYEHIPALEAVSLLAARMGDVQVLQRCGQLDASVWRIQLATEVAFRAAILVCHVLFLFRLRPPARWKCFACTRPTAGILLENAWGKP
jgi:hypothetical protein